VQSFEHPKPFSFLVAFLHAQGMLDVLFHKRFPMKKIRLVAAFCLAFSPLSVAADEISDALESAQQAYADGDIQYAIEELDFARQRLIALKTDALGVYLPEALDGWSREVDSEMGAALGMMGGGAGAEATYRNESDGSEYTVTLIADNPMIAGIAGMIGQASLMGIRVERIGRQKFMVQDGEMTGLIANRILVKVAGDDEELMKSVLESMDFRAIANFGN
jgi:hypothetical protein